MNEFIKSEFNEHLNTTKLTLDSITNSLNNAAEICITSLRNENKILICGNGGSAADAQHIASELVGRFKLERKGLRCIALTTDSSALTSISNDFGYEQVFERQVQALAKPGDILIGISTGGTSKNVINALMAANEIGCKTIGLSGKKGGIFNHICTVNLVVPSRETPRIQEMHIIIGHILCGLIDKAFHVK